MSDKKITLQKFSHFVSDCFTETPLTSKWGQKKMKQVLGKDPFIKDKKKKKYSKKAKKSKQMQKV